MTSLTRKSSKLFLGATLRVVTLALFLLAFGTSAALAQTKGYVSNFNDNTVSVIDTATNTVVATPSPGSFPIGIDITPNGASAYVSIAGNDAVAVMATASNTVVTTIPTGQDHRFIKKKVRASQCFQRFHTAERTLEGIEAMHMVRKGQVKRLGGSDARGQAKFVESLFGSAA